MKIEIFRGINKHRHMTFLRAPYSAILAMFFMATVSAAETRIWDKAYVHEPTGIVLPREMTGYGIESITDYADSDFDGGNLSVKYRGDVVNLDIYLYKPDESAESERELFEFERATGAIQRLAEEKKYYIDLEMPETATVLEYGLEEHPRRMISTEMNYRETIEDRNTAGFGEAKRESFLGVTFVEDFAVKIRHTYVLSGEKETDDLRRETRGKAVNFILGVIKEADFWPVVEEAIETLKTDPTDPDAASIVVAFTEASRLLQVTVASDWLPFLAEDDFENSTALLACFIAGNIAAQQQDQTFESQNLAGVRRMLEAYETLREAGKCEQHDVLESWLDEVKAGTFQLPEIKASE